MLDSAWFLSVYVGKYVEQIANNSWVEVVICVMGAVHTHTCNHTHALEHAHIHPDYLLLIRRTNSPNQLWDKL